MTQDEIYQACIEGLEFKKREIEDRMVEIRMGLVELATQDMTPGHLRLVQKAMEKHAGIAQEIAALCGKAASNGGSLPVAPKGIIKRHGYTVTHDWENRTKGHHRMSPEGKARIIAATKKRWKEYRRMKKAGGK